MPNFKGHEKIILQPNDKDIPFSFTFSSCTDTTSNDGYLPFGTTLSSVTIVSSTETGIVVNDLVSSISVTANAINMALSYPSSGPGRYHMTFIAELSTGSTIEADFNRIEARDL